MARAEAHVVATSEEGPGSREGGYPCRVPQGLHAGPQVVLLNIRLQCRTRYIPLCSGHAVYSVHDSVHERPLPDSEVQWPANDPDHGRVVVTAVVTLTLPLMVIQ